MLCEKCQTEKATVFLTRIVQEKMQKVDLCEKCAREMGVTNSSGFSLADMLLSPSFGKEPPVIDSAPEDTCPGCGCTKTEFRKDGRLGCPMCYRAFADILEGVLGEMQRSTRHCGKTPCRVHHAEPDDEALEGLRAELHVAVETEQFEEAARLRDQIRSLEQEA